MKNTSKRLTMPSSGRHPYERKKMLFTRDLPTKPKTPFEVELGRLHNTDPLDYVHQAQQQVRLQQQGRDRAVIQSDIDRKLEEYQNILPHDVVGRERVQHQILQLTDEQNAPDPDHFQQFLDDFNHWLVGRAYLKTFIDNRTDFINEIDRLKTFTRIDNVTLDTSYLYFKYIVRGRIDDPSTLGYLKEWDTMFTKVRREEQELYGISDDAAVTLDYLNSEYNAAGPPSRTYQALAASKLPNKMSEFSALLKQRDIDRFEQRGDSGNYPDTVDGRKAAAEYHHKWKSTIIEQRIRRNQLFTQLSQHRQERKDINALLSDCEAEEYTRDRDTLEGLLKTRATLKSTLSNLKNRFERVKQLGMYEQFISPVDAKAIQDEIDAREADHLKVKSMVTDLASRLGLDSDEKKLGLKTYRMEIYRKHQRQSMLGKDVVDAQGKDDSFLNTPPNVSKVLTKFILSSASNDPQGEQQLVLSDADLPPT
ncbi:hypothetical protein SAMD00019534_112990 [Acytostelium subglobosum LB1]|uniref:hypothetical protein n=1 Tax=Acytostelium subglobosum LB1 TaxID=1410327 RepID=UPI000645203E|nr:hypothetical protein SAMD00019534_112990 [Acytostelium subglobosum LB1]GAM28123.1 hypothetical protein SAMD00019534_112990 [Acytostelium subglobosum LB1]|eukprot:XP_012749082.1 hypothetical protein SAMD00019534_112990 [Acytostelium subglobosum LB1]